MKLERYVLASLLRTSQQQLAYQLKPDDFTDASYSKIFTLFINRLDKGQKADATLLTDPALEKDEVIALSDSLFIDSTDDASVLQEKIDELCRLSDLRFLADKAERLAASVKSGKLNSVNVAVDFLTNVSDDLIMRHPKELDVSLGSSLRSGLNRVEQRKKEQKIRTGINQIDNDLYGGIALGEYVIFAARPNVGKSIFSIMPAIQAAYDGLDVLIAVNEMDKESTSIRMMANIANVNINAIEGHIPFQSYEEDSLSVANAEMKRLPITFLENAYKIEDIEKILKTRQKLKKPIKLVIADMAGRMSTDTQKKTDREQLNEVSKGLFRLSKQYHCTIIGTVQISRAGLMNEEPQLSHLKETGKWEEDADKVFMMWQDKDDKDKRIIALRKNRTGKKDDKYTVMLDGCHMRFKEDV